MRLLAALAFVTVLLAPAATPQRPLAEVEKSDLGYDTVEEARAALAARTDVQTSVERGWNIIVDRKNLTVWSFSPPDHPSHPSVVKRQAVPVGEFSKIVMSVVCGGTKKACDDLVREFAAMNGMTPDE